LEQGSQGQDDKAVIQNRTAAATVGYKKESLTNNKLKAIAPHA